MIKIKMTAKEFAELNNIDISEIKDFTDACVGAKDLTDDIELEIVINNGMLTARRYDNKWKDGIEVVYGLAKDWGFTSLMTKEQREEQYQKSIERAKWIMMQYAEIENMDFLTQKVNIAGELLADIEVFIESLGYSNDVNSVKIVSKNAINKGGMCKYE